MDIEEQLEQLKQQHARSREVIERLLAKVLEQIDLAQENWDTAESEESGFDTLRECVTEVFRGEERK